MKSAGGRGFQVERTFSADLQVGECRVCSRETGEGRGPGAGDEGKTGHR